MGVISRYGHLLPITDKTPKITMGEGGTPLIGPPITDRLARWAGFRGKLYLKMEGSNTPTYSFKDRGMVMAIAKALEEGARAVICASTGNTSASAASYSAAFGLKCFVLVPEGNVALGKIAQAVKFGARVIQIQGSFDKALTLVRQISESCPITLVNSLNPYRVEGQKTAAFEIMDALVGCPDYLFIPVGNAANIYAYWEGFKAYSDYWKRAGSSAYAAKWGRLATSLRELPRMMGYRAADPAHTFASAIRITQPARWEDAQRAAEESGGKIDTVTDGQIRAAYNKMPALTGLFGEPASQASIAGLKKAVTQRDIINCKDSRAVCVITGNGLKDPDNAMKGIDPPVVLPLDVEEIASYMAL